MSGQWRPMLLLWLAVAVGMCAVLDDIGERVMHRVDEWVSDRRELRRLEREEALRREIARVLHPSSRRWN